ncbi:MAG: XRE family transcriptional regulator [Chloroflexota bacterium]|nr:MAG: XRE family transcriptional regulator [Chloroflexota bacterium]
MADLPIDGARIKALRGKLSQGQIRIKSGLSQSFISQIETGARKSISDESVRLLAKALGVRPIVILDPEFVATFLTPEEVGAGLGVAEGRAAHVTEELPKIMPQPVPILSIPAFLGGRLSPAGYIYSTVGEAERRNLWAVQIGNTVAIVELGLIPSEKDRVVFVREAKPEIAAFVDVEKVKEISVLGVLVEERRKTGR